MRGGHRLRLDLRSGTEWLAYYTRDFDNHLIAAACALMTEPGCVAIDAGANIGFWSVPLARRALELQGGIVAFEPVPSNAARLQHNLRMNGLLQVAEIIPAALSDSSGEATMILREDFEEGAATGNASIEIPDGRDDRYSSVQVATVTLDECAISALGRGALRVIKCDIEGHEDRFLSGATDTVARHRPIIFLEWNRAYYDRRRVDQTAQVQPFLDKLQYRTLLRTDGAWKPALEFRSPRPFDDLVVVPDDEIAATVSALEVAYSPYRRRRSCDGASLKGGRDRPGQC
ncbi:FkbM family methyltransferase [Lysobacter korlensis]|uniref:FkbM family methyltransferase n=2 Tax=Lysobacter korlensis TaxID=553636 RepID=A0ABV6RYA9_9GAMM